MQKDLSKALTKISHPIVKKNLHKIVTKKPFESLSKPKSKETTQPSVKFTTPFVVNNNVTIPDDLKLIESDTTNLKNKKIAIIIRGHIRESFETNILYNFLKNLESLYDVTFYLHTWHKSEARVSWRKLSTNMFDINEKLIKHYLKDIKYEKLIIDNDYNIELVGNKEGRVGLMPLIGWKRMWYGKYKIINYVKEEGKSYDAIINFRWDNFICQSSKHIITDSLILYNIKKYLLTPEPKKSIYFIKDELFYGIDNYYIGNIKQIYNLTHKFNFSLDALMKKYLKYKNQEFLVYIEAVKYFQK